MLCNVCVCVVEVVVVLYITENCIHLADAFMQSDIQIVHIESTAEYQKCIVFHRSESRNSLYLQSTSESNHISANSLL